MSGPDGPFDVIWWDPHALELGVEPGMGLKRESLIAKDVPEPVIAEGIREYDAWRSHREQAIARGAAASIAVRRATEWAASSDVLDPMSGRLEPAGQRGLFDEPISVPASAPQDDVEVVDARGREALGGPRFGELVHALLASTPLNADRTQLDALAEVHGRVLPAPPEEVGAAAAVVERLLNHPLLRRARAADARSACRRETPATIVMPDGVLVEGIVDLAFEED